MNEDQARQIAGALGGQAWQSGGGIWIVILRRKEGRLAVISSEAVCEYENEEAFGQSVPSKAILLA